MLTIDQVASYFPEHLFRANPHGALVEYLQYELLDSLYKNAGSAHLSFIGGTAIRILHQSVRFSEDLDFDCFGLAFTDFEALLAAACKDMEYKGFVVEYRVVERGAYHCYIRFPEILFRSGISPEKGKKILLQVDSEIKESHYSPRVAMLNKFAVFRRILAAPPEILLAQKMMAVVLRKREKGRDLFDVSFLMGITRPDFAYIEKSLGVGEQAFRRMFSERLDVLDLEFLARDVEPFLFTSDQKERVLYFRETWGGKGEEGF
jgi:predicted nucleotidyltransferase component of viral defense system